VANTVHMIVSDPIMELGANNLNTGDLGIIMTRHGESGNVAIIFDESTDTLEIGYTTGNHMDTTITIDDSSLFHTNIHGNVSVSNLNIGQFSVVPSYGLDHVTNENNSTGDTLISTNATTGLQTTANVSVGRDALVSGNVEVSQDLTVTGNIAVDTDTLFVDATTDRVGVGTTSPNTLLELSKATGSATISPTELRLTTTTNAADWDTTNSWARLAFYTNDITGDAPGVMASVGAVASSVDGGENTRLAFFTAEPHLERMCVDRYGNVGIGTTSPQYQLDVDGGTTEGAGDVMLRLMGAVNRTGKLILGRSGNSDIRSHAIEVNNNSGGANNFMKFLVHDGGSSSPYETRTEVMTLLGDGNVGIGTTSPNRQLQIYGDSSNYFSFSPTEADDTSVDDKTNFGATSMRKQMMMRLNNRNWYWGIVNNASNYLGLGADGGGGNDPDIQCVFQNDGTFWTKNIRTSGNVGIGTTSPIAALDINGGAENNTTPALSIRGGLYDPSDLYVLNTYNVNTGVGYAAKVIGVNIKNKVETDNTVQIRNNVGGITSAGAIYLGSDDVNQGIFGVLGGTGTVGSTLAEYLTVKGNGNVGIGTNNPGVKLQVGGNAETTPQYIRIRGERVNAAGDICGIQMYNSANSGDRGNSRITNSRGANNYGSNLEFWTNPDSNAPATEKMRITSTGNVGIGTASPTQTLDVNGSVRQRGANTYLDWAERRIIMNYDNTYRQGIKFSTGTREMTLFSTTGDSGGSIIFKTRAGGGSSDTDYGTERMRITGGGNVGIGTNSPGYKLHVNGSMKNNNPCFYARRNATQGTGVYIFNVQELDSHNAYNPTNGRFTAPIAGRYVFNVWAMSNGATVLYTEFRKNGSRVYNATPYTGNVGSYGNIAGTIVINLAVNDYIDINVLQGAAYGGGNDHNGFCGYMIG